RDGIAFNTLWPRTLIATAALQAIPGAMAIVSRARKPEIMADAAYVIFNKSSREFTGQHCIDDLVLASAGVTDLRAYRMQPGNDPLETDLFVPDDMPPPAGIQV
ncbi:MAG: SDR family oxidoreductase, partial [Nevskiales bacterium]